METASTTLALADTMVVFDWNGTVVLDADRARASLNSVLATRLLEPLTSEEFSHRFRLPMGRMFRDLGVQPLELDEAEAEWNFQMTQTSTCLRAGTNAAFLELSKAGAWLGVVSAASAKAVEFDQRSLSVLRVLNTIDASVSDKVTQLLKHRNRRNRAFYIGDTAYDIHSASAAGYIPIGVSGGYSPEHVLREAGATHIIKSLSELITIVSTSHRQAQCL